MRLLETIRNTIFTIVVTNVTPGVCSFSYLQCSSFFTNANRSKIDLIPEFQDRKNGLSKTVTKPLKKIWKTTVKSELRIVSTVCVSTTVCVYCVSSVLTVTSNSTNHNVFVILPVPGEHYRTKRRFRWSASTSTGTKLGCSTWCWSDKQFPY
jgi:hypothetical protein